MSLIARPTASPGSPTTVLNDGFWPDIDLTRLRLACRLDATVTAERLIEAAARAVDSVNIELHPWRTARIAEGHATLAEVPAPTPNVAGVSVLELRYRSAIHAAVQVDLAERYRDIDTTKGGDRRADEMDPRIQDLRRDLRWAISDLLGLRRTTIELI